MLTYKYLKYKNKYINKKNKINNDKLNVEGGDYRIREKKEDNKPHMKLFDCLTQLDCWYEIEQTSEMKPWGNIIILSEIGKLMELTNNEYKYTHQEIKISNENFDGLELKLKLFYLLMTIKPYHSSRPNCENVIKPYHSSRSNFENVSDLLNTLQCDNFDIIEDEKIIIISFKRYNKLDYLWQHSIKYSNQSKIFEEMFEENYDKYLECGMIIVCKFLAANDYQLLKLLITQMNKGKKIYLVGHSFGGVSALYIHIILQYLYNYDNLETYIYGGLPIIPKILQKELSTVYYILNEFDPLSIISLNENQKKKFCLPIMENLYVYHNNKLRNSKFTNNDKINDEKYVESYINYKFPPNSMRDILCMGRTDNYKAYYLITEFYEYNEQNAYNNAFYKIVTGTDFDYLVVIDIFTNQLVNINNLIMLNKKSINEYLILIIIILEKIQINIKNNDPTMFKIILLKIELKKISNNIIINCNDESILEIINKILDKIKSIQGEIDEIS